MNNSQRHPDCSTDAALAMRMASEQRAARSGLAFGFALTLTLAPLFLTSCDDEPASQPAAEATKPAEPPVPDDIDAAAHGFLGKETKVLIFGDLAKNGKQQFVAANIVPKTPKNENLSGTIITRAVVAENDDGRWNELLRVDEHLKNSKGFLALNPLGDIAGWRIQYEQDPVKGLQLYFTPLQGQGVDNHLQPIGIAWNPETQRYQSLDRTYEHFLLESPTLGPAKSRLR